LVHATRRQVGNWRESGYAAASDTTKTLLNYWFETAHPNDFRYHFAQREAVETVIWLYEIAGYRSLGAMFASLIPETAGDYEVLVNSVPDEEDQWARYCTKLATGGGKTKCMSLLIVWSYFNSLYENEEEFARHFVLVAPNLIVFDRLLEDFVSSEDEQAVFYRDPVLPPEFADDFSLQTVVQDEAGGGAYRGTLYLTNIHRLYDKSGSQKAKAQPPSWAGPEVKPNQVFAVGEKLRERITNHPLVMVMNDEAHHLHDEDLAWPKAIDSLHRQSVSKGNKGLMCQLDFTATPKHNDGRLFRHIVSDFPLGEAVDSGIVKVPVIGKSDELIRFDSADNAFEEYRNHLVLGYKQYESYFHEWEGSAKPVMFVMTETAKKSDEIAAQLNNDDRFPLLKGKVLNLHTRLKGKIVKKKVAGRELLEFVPSEKGISDEDLKVLRELSKQLDEPNSPYRCVVSVLMLREGWDVRNVSTIVPLRPFSAASNILPEQTLGRGLRRMTRPGDALERVTVVEHSAFIKFYKEELEQEGLDIAVEELEDAKKPQSVTIFVDDRKGIEELDISIPSVSDSVQAISTIEGLQFEQIRSSFLGRFKPLPVLEPKSSAIKFEERTLFTDEVVRTFELERGLLQMGATALSVYVRLIERQCRLQNSFAVIAPFLERFVQEVLFERPVSLYSGEIDHRMGDLDVAEHIGEVFVPIIREATVSVVKRKSTSSENRISLWRNYQATNSDRRPCVVGERTLFNLAPCGNRFEAEFVDFLDECKDVVAFVKNAGPQKLMIDYLAISGRPALYWPDFVVRLKNGSHMVVETKGQTDAEAALQAKAAVEWCKTASKGGSDWSYVFLTTPLFESNNEFSMEALSRACLPKLNALLNTLKTKQAELPFDSTPEEVRRERADDFLGDLGISGLPPRTKTAVEQAVSILAFDKRMGHSQFGPAFQALLEPWENLCGALAKQELMPYVPSGRDEQKYYFEPYMDNLPGGLQSELRKHTINLRKNLMFDAHNNRIGNLLFCMSLGESDRFRGYRLGGVWDDVVEAFSGMEYRELLPTLNAMNDFRNRFVVHLDEPLTDVEVAEQAMRLWVRGIVEMQAILA
jgi:type III restriction enzyme